MHPILVHELARQRVQQIERDRRIRRRTIRGRGQRRNQA
jgi:hypothetical protein